MPKTQLVLSVQDNKLIDKLEAHKKGIKHYAFSVLIFNDKSELLLQKRSSQKYHSGNLWTNTCCSHPLSQDLQDVALSAKQRLKQEMGLQCAIEYLFTIEYEANCGQLIENEVDIIFIGITNQRPTLNKNEATDYKWLSLDKIWEELTTTPDNYTKWFQIIMKKHMAKFKNYLENIIE